ncbi:MAG TPA: hypothetical protein VGR50_06990, partial [Terriglobales bacterium]|nr:hypothetical protein [Terriglobales bacterium]
APSQPEPQTSPTDAGHIPMTEELDSAKWNLPPIIPVLIAAAVIALVVFLYTWHSSKPLINARILGAYATQAGPSQVLVGVQLSVQNATQEPIWIKDIRVELKPSGEAADKPALSDRAAPASDLDRYLQAFPDLAAHKMPPLSLDEKIDPGSSTEGMVVVSFPVAKDVFDKRQSLKVTFDLQDHLPVTIKQ